jgi:hypothetical protein
MDFIGDTGEAFARRAVLRVASAVVRRIPPAAERVAGATAHPSPALQRTFASGVVVAFGATAFVLHAPDLVSTTSTASPVQALTSDEAGEIVVVSDQFKPMVWLATVPPF